MNTQNTPRSGESKNMLKKNIKLLYIEIISVLLCITGIVLLCCYTTTLGYEIVEDYTDCKNFNQLTTKCKDTLETKKEPCDCYITLNITQPMDAVVTVFYELESNDQSSYSNSRDDKQLSGELSLTPSESCSPFMYADTTEGKKPIAPCGEVADSMFNDTFSLQINNKYVPYLNTGLLSEVDKAPYRNPPGNLTEAFKNFTKPTNWTRNVWELDTKNPDNNGFQNEAFIVWMKTDLKRKPAWRINHKDLYVDGVPAGEYTLHVTYAYPPSRYDGRRKFIISSVREVVNPFILGFGIALLVLGFMILIGKIFYNKKASGTYIQCETRPLNKG